MVVHSIKQNRTVEVLWISNEVLKKQSNLGNENKLNFL